MDQPVVSPLSQLGSVSHVPDKPGHFVRLEGRSGQAYKPSLYSRPYVDVLIPVLHRGAIASGVDKCELCRHHLDGDCRRGVRCTYAHSWDERLEWICPTCTNDHKLECDNKWQHILSYKKLGVMVVDDGRSVADFLKFS